MVLLRTLSPVALVLSILVGTGRADEVIVLESATLDKHLKENARTLVMFYAPWCGHCKKLAPEYEKAAVELKSADIKLAKIDATAAKDIAMQYSVKGFPTLTWFEDGQEVPFDGQKNADGIVAWVTTMRGNAVIIATPGAPGKDKPQMILYADSLLNGFLDAAKLKRRKAEWYFVQTQTRYPKITVVHANEQPIELTGYSCSDKAKITAFLDDNQMPLFGPMDGDTWDKYLTSGKGLVWSLFEPGEGSFDALVQGKRQMMEDVAKKFKGKYHVTYTDMSTHKEAVEGMISIDRLPAIAVQTKAGGKHKYVYDGEMIAWKISEFITDVDYGKISPKLRSEPVPGPSEELVKYIVGSTFKEEVFTPDKDVILEVYAPWCGHCKKMKPEYEKLAKKIDKDGMNDLLKFAWIDGVANDSPVETMDWTGFPTVYFVKAGQDWKKDKPSVYEGERSAKAIWRYVRRHSTHSEEIKARIAKKEAAEHRGSEL